MRLRLTESEFRDLTVALYDAIDYEESFLDAYDNCTDAEAKRTKRKTRSMIVRFTALRKKIGTQRHEQKNRRKA